MTTFSQLRIASSARPLVDQTLARATSTTQRREIERALIAAAAQNGNRVLTAHEVKLVADAFELARPGGGKLTGDELAQGLGAAYAAAGSMGSLSNVDGISTHFTFQESLAQKLIGELNDAVKSADGKPMDVVMMIFEFQSDEIEAAITDLAKKNPNVTFRIVGDSGQASSTGGNALPSLLKKNLPNVEIKFKKDFPYTFDQAKGIPRYNHNATEGLLHHKGFATFVDGKPDRLVSGSFNWSDTADTKNYEDLSVFKNVDASTKGAITAFGDEFAGLWNNDAAALSPNAFFNFKKEQWNAMLVANGKSPDRFTPKADDSLPGWTRPADTSVDVNGLKLSDKAGLEKLLGKAVAKAVQSELLKYGRFESIADLKERVSSTNGLPEETLAQLGFGSGQVSVNNASWEELDRIGFTQKQARAIVAYREQHGDFETLDDLKKVPGVTTARLKTVGERVNLVDVEGFFNSRPFGAARGGTGYGPAGERTTLATGNDGVIGPMAANVTVAANDLFNAAKAGTKIDVAMYGMSVGAPEYNALVAAAKRGAEVRVVLNDDYTASTVAALKSLQAQGFDIDVRVQKAKTMHEKFGVVGNDVFSGSANFSSSSSTKHSENRFAIKNHDETAQAFRAEFDAIWAKSK